MKYTSTRNSNGTKYSAAQVIKQGLAEDGGLFLPEEIPALSKDNILELCKDTYPVAAAKILSKFLNLRSYIFHSQKLSFCHLLMPCKAFSLHVPLKRSLS